MEPKVLATQEIRLRPWREDDARWIQEPDEASRLMVTRMQPTPSTYAEWLRDREQQMAVGAGIYWCIADAASDEPLGYVQLRNLDIDFTRGNGEIGYWLYPQARGRGIAGQAVELVREYAFGELGLHRLQAGTDIANFASARVLRRAGFRMWGIEQSVLAHDDRAPSDALNWELLASDDVDAQRVSPCVIPTIELDGLRLRPWRDDDVDGLPDEADALAKHYLPTGAHVDKATYPRWHARQRRFIDEGSVVGWCIADGPTDAPLGSISIFNIGEATVTSAEVGYWLFASGRGRGALGVAMEAVCSHAFTSTQDGGLGLTRLYAETDLDNVASQSVLRAAGFRKWGEDRQAYTAADGRITDGAYFELLAGDDRETQRALKPPALDFPQVRLRPFRRDDAAALARSWAEPEVRRWLSVPQDDLDRRARDYVALRRYVDTAGHGCWWVVCADRDDTAEVDFAGVIGLQHFEDGAAEVGYWLSTNARDRGLATHALEAVTSYAFMPEAHGGLGLRRVHIGIAEGNDRSAAVADRAGYREFGCARRAERLGDGTVVDLHLYERLADA
ncbi:GNAT family N-acetyltransferase [Flexivirga sp. B27]